MGEPKLAHTSIPESILILPYLYGATSRARALDAAKRAAAYAPSISKSFLAYFIFASAFLTFIFWAFAA